MRRLKTKTTGAKGIAVTADDFVVALLDRLIKNEKQLDAIKRVLDEHFEMIAELQPRLSAEGLVKLRAMCDGVEMPTEKTVLVSPIIIEKGADDGEEKTTA